LRIVPTDDGNYGIFNPVAGNGSNNSYGESAMAYDQDDEDINNGSYLRLIASGAQANQIVADTTSGHVGTYRNENHAAGPDITKSPFDSNGNDNVVDPYSDPDRAKNPYFEDRTPHGRENWPEARRQVTSDPTPAFDNWKDGPNYYRYVNCSDDAIENAAITLDARVKTFGKDHAGVKEWVKAQDAVFLNCEGLKDPALPEPPSASLPGLLRFDREYQIAAAHMYAGHFDDAEKSFERIAAEEKSPWRSVAPYLVARNLVRRASLDVPADAKPQENRGFNIDCLKRAEAKIQELLREVTD